MGKFLPALILLSLASYASAATTPQAFGAKCDGQSDDRLAIQAALDSGSAEIHFSGTCMVSQADYAAYDLIASAPVLLTADPGAMLQQLPGQGASVRLLQIDVPGVVIDGLTFDGNWTMQSVDEHRAGIFARAGFTIRNSILQNFTGDGVSLYMGTYFVVLNVTMTGNQRDGLSCIGETDDITVTSSKFVNNAKQQFDLEPGGYCDHVRIRDSLFDGGTVSSDYVLAISRGHHFTIENSVINGAINTVHSSDVFIEHNVGINTSTKSMVYVYLDSNRVFVIDNQFVSQSSQKVVEVTGTDGTGLQPVAHVVGNTLSGSGQTAIVYAQGSDTVDISNNMISCSAAGLGIGARATLSTPFNRVDVRGNSVAGCGRPLAITGNGSAQLLQLTAGGNDFGSLSSSLDDKSGALRWYLGDLTVSRWPSGAVLTTTPVGTMMTR